MQFTGVIGDAIFVADFYYKAIYLASLNPSERALISLPFSNLAGPHSIAIDPFDARIYWTDWTRNIIARSSFDDKSQEIIHSSVSAPMGIALDLVGKNVYWISSGTGNAIEVSKLNGEQRKVLVSNLPSAVFDITLDTTRG